MQKRRRIPGVFLVVGISIVVLSCFQFLLYFISMMNLTGTTGVSTPNFIFKIAETEGLPQSVTNVMINQEKCHSCQNVAIFLVNVPKMNSDFEWKRLGGVLNALQDNCACNVGFFVLDISNVGPHNIDALDQLKVKIYSPKNKKSWDQEEMEETLKKFSPHIMLFHISEGSLKSGAYFDLHEMVHELVTNTMPNTKVAVLSDGILLEDSDNTTYSRQKRIFESAHFAGLLSDPAQMAHRLLFPHKSSGIVRYMQPEGPMPATLGWSERSGIILVGEKSRKSEKLIDEFLESYMKSVKLGKIEHQTIHITGTYHCRQSYCCKFKENSQHCAVVYGGIYGDEETLDTLLKRSQVLLSLDPDKTFNELNIHAFHSNIPVLVTGAILDGSCYRNGLMICEYCMSGDLDCLFQILGRFSKEKEFWENAVEIAGNHVRESFTYSDLKKDVGRMLDELAHPTKFEQRFEGPHFIAAVADTPITIPRLTKIFKIIDSLHYNGMSVSILNPSTKTFIFETTTSILEIAKIGFKTRGVEFKVSTLECRPSHDTICLHKTMIDILSTISTEHERIIFIGDVIPTYQTVWDQLSIDLNYDILCTMQVNNNAFHRITDTRSIYGDLPLETYPFFADSFSKELVYEQLPVRVSACWSDLVLLNRRIVEIVKTSLPKITCDNRLSMYWSRMLWSNGDSRIFVSTSNAIDTNGNDVQMPDKKNSDRNRLNSIIKLFSKEREIPSKIICCNDENECKWVGNSGVYAHVEISMHRDHYFEYSQGFLKGALNDDRLDIDIVMDEEEILSKQGELSKKILSRLSDQNHNTARENPAFYYRLRPYNSYLRPRHCPSRECKFVLFFKWDFGHVPLSLIEESTIFDMIAVSTTNEKKGMINSGIPRRKIAVVPYGSDLTTVDQRKGESQPFKFLYHGYLQPQYGLDRLIQTYFDEFYKDTGTCLIIYTSDMDADLEFTELVRKGISSAKLYQGVCIEWYKRDYFKEEEIDEIYSNTNAVIIQSNQNNILPIACMRKVPIIGSRLDLPQDCYLPFTSHKRKCALPKCRLNPPQLCRRSNDCDRLYSYPYFYIADGRSLKNSMRKMYSEYKEVRKVANTCYIENLTWASAVQKCTDVIRV